MSVRPPMKVPQMPRMCRCMRSDSKPQISADSKRRHLPVAYRIGLAAKDEVDRAHQADCGVKVVHLHFLAHVEHGKRYEYHERDHFLQDLQLREAHDGETDEVGGHLEQVFEQRD